MIRGKWRITRYIIIIITISLLRLLLLLLSLSLLLLLSLILLYYYYYYHYCYYYYSYDHWISYYAAAFIVCVCVFSKNLQYTYLTLQISLFSSTLSPPVFILLWCVRYSTFLISSLNTSLNKPSKYPTHLSFTASFSSNIVPSDLHTFLISRYSGQLYSFHGDLPS